ncbi:probable transcription factor At1g11510 [Capsella rubella]|uniref:probable transcription factor At1g11510 n=1 Tax=Capsella rubella TaxID=81985 RepID=UPI000CD54937|nr:probable transcription factor At1g11510 [Capsella rubella]
MALATVDPNILVLTEKKVEAGVTVKKVEAPMKLVVTEKQEVNRSVEKRSPETTNEGDSVKRVKVSEKKEKKKPNFQRVWSEDDEVAILQGLIDYKTDTKVDPKILVLTEKKVEDGVTVKKVEAPMKPVVTEKQEVKRYVENRSSETTNEGDSVNRGKVSEKKEKKKPNFQHVWSEDDEVALLQGLINYKTDTGGEALESTGKSKRVASLKHEDAERVSSSLVRTLVYVGVDELAAQQGLSMIALEDKKRYEEQKALQAREFDFYSEKAKFLHQMLAISRLNA